MVAVHVLMPSGGYRVLMVVITVAIVVVMVVVIDVAVFGQS